MEKRKPSEMFVKYRILDVGEEYNPDIHNIEDTIRERGGEFYDEENLKRMEEEKREEEREKLKKMEEEREKLKKMEEEKEEEEREREGERLKAVRCAICFKFIIYVEECTVCSEGHKFHKKCLRGWWRMIPLNSRKCPLTNTIPPFYSDGAAWKNCTDINDLHSGGKRRKRRYSNKNKKNKNHKRNFVKSKKRK
jgi:hypothetical protein